MPRPTPKRGPRQGDYFQKPGIDKEAIIRVVRPSADDPEVHLWAGHGFRVDDPEAANGSRWINAFCLGTPADPSSPGLSESGVSRCLTIGPIGESGSFLHDFEWDWYFNCFVFVHSLEGVLVNKVQVWSQRQGAVDGGVYSQLNDALTNAEDAGKRVSEVLLRLKGMPVRNFPKSSTVSVTYLGEPAGRFAEYTLTDRMKTGALETMERLRHNWDPRRTEAELREELGIKPSAAPADDADDPFSDGGDFDSGLGGHPKSGSDLP
jgi:hypothetical protein